MFVFVWFFVPETKGKPLRIIDSELVSFRFRSRITGVSLERMDELFGVTEAPKDVTAEADEAPHQKSGTEITEKPVERPAEV